MAPTFTLFSPDIVTVVGAGLEIATSKLPTTLPTLLVAVTLTVPSAFAVNTPVSLIAANSLLSTDQTTSCLAFEGKTLAL